MLCLTRSAGLAILVAVVSGLGGAASADGSAATDARWVMRDLGRLEVLAINDRGQIVGSRQGGGCGGQPILWQNGKVTVLTRAGDCGVANAINASGQIVGWHFGSKSEQDAFLWKGGELTNLAFDAINEATGINGRGHVVGTSAFWGESDDPYTGLDGPHAWLWRSGKKISIGGAGKASAASGLNDSGVAVGWHRTTSGRWRALVWRNGKTTELGTLPGHTVSKANAINGRGQVVGASFESWGGAHDAFVWKDGRLSVLGPRGGTQSTANAINERGQIVGSSDARSRRPHAVVWENGQMIDLGTLPGGTESSAVDINNRGEAIGSSTTRTGETHAVLWTRRSG